MTIENVADIYECEGYKKLLLAVEKDEVESPRFHDYRGKLEWIVKRAQHYAEKLDLDACNILNAWEKARAYWYMNFYQDCEQPEIKSDRVRVFEDPEELHQAIGKEGFRCPMCGGVSKSPYECDSGLDMSPGKKCDWKSWGLFHDLGKGIYIYVKSELQGQIIFMPLAWETEKEKQP
jgi:hypothetical protein